MTLEIKGIECQDMSDALGWIDAQGHGLAIRIGGKVLVVEKAEAIRIEALGVSFAYLFDHQMPDGRHRIVTVPIND